MAAKTTSTLAKSDDGSVQLTLKIPFKDLEQGRESAAKSHQASAEIKGFRKGKAPLEKVKEHVGLEHLTEHALNLMLPGLFNAAIKEHGIKPAVLPKFELIKAQEEEDWEIRAITAEAPMVDLGDYRSELTPKIITNKGEKEQTREVKEQRAIEILLKTAKVAVPKVLLDEEVNGRLAGLLERIEKLGLSLDSYLASIKKSSEQLRAEYLAQAETTLKLEFILIEIANKEKVSVEEKEIDEFIKAAEANPEYKGKFNTEDQRRTIASIIRKRKTLDFLVSLL